jgi:adenosylmethionine-8-amino-7-oxononanoate aminotransferase
VSDVPTAYLHPFAPPTSERFITLVRGEGSTVFDDEGRAYLDGMASLWYCNAGHGRAEIADAVRHQMGRLATYHTFAPFTNEPAERMAALVAERAPMPDARVFLVSSGSEAVDSAIKLARIVQHLRGRPDKHLVVSRDHGYHGVTYGGLSAQGIPDNQAGFGALVPGFVRVPHHDLEAVSRVLAERGDEVAAVVAEPVQGAGGVHPPVPGYLEGLRRLCDRHDALLILDEVICGFGRLGTWFGADRYGVRPDLVTFAKGVTSGYVPLGGVIVGAAVRDALEADPSFTLRHGHTFSGHPAACAAGVANLEVLEHDGLLASADRIGGRLAAGLGALEADGELAEVRGAGAVWAAQLHPDRDAVAVRDRMLELGVIARPLFGALAFCPPLVMTDDEVDRCVDALATALRG